MNNSVRAGVSVAGNMEVFGHVKNLSTGGAYLLIHERFPVNCACTVRLMVEGEPGDLSVEGWVVHDKEIGMAIQFDKLDKATRDGITRIMDAHLSSAG